MRIKNKHILHFVRNKKYLCIRAVKPTPEKSTFLRERVKCFNCKRILRNEKRSIKK